MLVRVEEKWSNPGYVQQSWFEKQVHSWLNNEIKYCLTQLFIEYEFTAFS
jgi:hypothetical protein